MKNNRDIKYPPIRVEEENEEYAKLLLEDLAGCMISELTASTQYFNHEAVIFKEYPEVAMVLEGIGEVEIEHLQILLKLINLLGVSPKYRTIRDDGKKVWWAGSCVEYEEDILDLLESDLEGEFGAIFQYEKHLSLIHDKYIRDILNVIIDGEKHHAKIIISMIEDIKVGKKIEATKSCVKDYVSHRMKKYKM